MPKRERKKSDLTSTEKFGIIDRLSGAIARYGAERYYREESPGLIGQDNG